MERGILKFLSCNNEPNLIAVVCEGKASRIPITVSISGRGRRHYIQPGEQYLGQYI